MPGPAFFRDLGLFVVPDFLDPAYCAELTRQMAVAPLEPATVITAEGEEHVHEDVRKLAYCLLPQDLRYRLKTRLLELMPELAKHFRLELEGCESPDYLIYNPGDYFKLHTDGGGAQKKDSIRRRRVSVVIFLNRESEEPAEDTYGNGHLTFYGLMKGPWEKLPLPLNAEPGLLVAFAADLLHEVTPVTHGQRFTVVTWFYGQGS